MNRLPRMSGGAISRLDSLVGQRVQLWCMNYVYAGTLQEATETDVLLSNAVVVFETGALNDPQFKYTEAVPGGELGVMRSSIESFALAPQLR